MRIQKERKMSSRSSLVPGSDTTDFGCYNPLSGISSSTISPKNVSYKK